MKRVVVTTGILLMLVSAGSKDLNAQRGYKEGADSTHIRRYDREMRFDKMRERGHQNDSLFVKRMHEGFAPGPGYRNMRADYRWNRSGMRNGMRPEPFDRMGMGFKGNDRYRIESLPDLTDKQKAEIFTLRQNQLNEMKKFRDELVTKMKLMREDNRKKILGILTDEQRKLLESEKAKPEPATPKVK